MANKLAGQRAKFSRARAIYFTAPDETARERAVELMAEVITNADRFGFTEDLVTQGEDVPDVVRDHLRRQGAPILEADPVEEDPDALIRSLEAAVDATDVQEVGHGPQWVYAYGYCCAPDRLKIGSTTAEVEARIAAQIGTGTPDKPRLVLKIATHDCRALERALHGALRLRGKQIEGAGAEWFLVARDELVTLYREITDGM